MKTKLFSQDSEQPVIAARLERATYDQLKAMAEQERRPLGSLIRNILEDHVKSASEAGGATNTNPASTTEPLNRSDSHG